MVSGNPEGGQRECRGAQDLDQREQTSSQIGSIPPPFKPAPESCSEGERF
jgi:hypothetical protein